MRLLILTQYFPPEMGAPQARLYELAMRLKGMGHEVTVLTGMPNYPTGKIFDGYRRRVRVVEDMNGLRVIRTCLYPSKSSRSLPRLMSYLSFAASFLVLGCWGLGRQDVTLIESPPLFIMPAALLVSRIVRSKAVMMVSDIWPDILVRMGHAKDGLGLKLMLWLERYSYRHSYAVALTNPGACRQIRERFPKLRNVTVISNGVDTKFFRPELRSEATRAELGAVPGDFLVGYCGLHGLAQGLEAVMIAADMLRDASNIKFVMIGDGPTKERLVARAREMKLTNVTFLSYRPKKEMPAILASLDVSLVPLAERFPGTMPSKVYEALAAGVPPVVAAGCEGDALVSQFEAGVTYEPGDGAAMAKVIRELAESHELWKRMRENAIHLSCRFDRDVIVHRTEKILKAVASGLPLPEVAW